MKIGITITMGMIGNAFAQKGRNKAQLI